MTPDRKLLLVADTYYPKVDGTLKFMEEFLRRAKDEFKISLLVPYLGSWKKTRRLPAVTEHITYVQPSQLFQISGYQNMKLTRRNIFRIKQAIKDTDLVFVQGPALLSYLSIYYARRYQKNTVFYVHVIPWELYTKFIPRIVRRPFFALFRRFVIAYYNRCDEILVPYYELQNQLKNEGVRTKINVATLGVDIQIFSPARDKRINKQKIGISPEKKVIGYVGRISREKNIHNLLEAFKMLEGREKSHLLIVGDGPEKQKAELLKLPNCTITGFVHNVQDYLKAMDVFVMPSSTETTSLATLEAMSCGLPVIATKVGFIKSYLNKNHNGIFIPRDNPAVLALKIKMLLDDTSLCTQLGQNARKTIVYSFSWERSINRIRRILNEHFYPKVDLPIKEE
ncbi:glycosyltransferase [Candidatus Woesearchaeota archaeon]|nr:glycosyltransferase [Candidatus Woesearchaeota archaeon]